MTKKKSIVVHQSQMISSSLLEEHPKNSNKQNRHIQKEIKTSIKDNGFDEALIVCPKPAGEGYWIVSGNHRYRAGKALGMQEFPCVVREDWDSVEQQIQLVRRNYIRGKIDKATFTENVNTLSQDAAIGLDVIRERMGFEDPDSFAEYFQKEKEQDAKIAEAITSGGARGGGTTNVRMIDDLGLVLSTIFERFGDTVPYSFIIFPAGNKTHMYIQCTPALKRILDAVALGCTQQQLDMNIALGGLLAIGMDQSSFKTSTPDLDTVVNKGSELGDAEFTLPKIEDDE